MRSWAYLVDAIPAPDSPATGPTVAVSTRLRVWRILRYVIGLVLAGLAVYAVSGKTDELSGASAYIDHLNWAWVVLAAVAEAFSYVAFAGMQRRLLGAGHVRVALRPMTSISLAGDALQTDLPGGIIVSAAWSFRQFRRFGADEVLTGWVLVAMTAVSITSLSGLAAIGLAMAASTGSALGLVGAIIGLAVAIAAVGALRGPAACGWSATQASSVRLSQRIRPVGRRAIPTELVEEALAKLAAISPSRVDWAVGARLGRRATGSSTWAV